MLTSWISPSHRSSRVATGSHTTCVSLIEERLYVVERSDAGVADDAVTAEHFAVVPQPDRRVRVGALGEDPPARFGAEHVVAPGMGMPQQRRIGECAGGHACGAHDRQLAQVAGDWKCLRQCGFHVTLAKVLADDIPMLAELAIPA